MRSIWTLAVVAVLALFAAFAVGGLFQFGPVLNLLPPVMFGTYLYVTLAIVVSELASAALYLYPQFGPQSGQ